MKRIQLLTATLFALLVSTATLAETLNLSSISPIERVAIVEQFPKCAAREAIIAKYGPQAVKQALLDSARGWQRASAALLNLFELHPELAGPVFDSEVERMELLVMSAEFNAISDATDECNQYEPLKVDIVRQIKADIYAKRE